MRTFLLQLKVPFFHSSRSHSQDTVERFSFNRTAWHRDVMTSQHDESKLIFPISACRCTRKRILFCFYKTLGCWVRKCCQFCICMMTSRHDVMSWLQEQAVLYISLVEVLERRFVFCFYSSPACRVQKCYRFRVCMMSWRNDVTSWCYKARASTTAHPPAPYSLPPAFPSPPFPVPRRSIPTIVTPAQPVPTSPSLALFPAGVFPKF